MLKNFDTTISLKGIFSGEHKKPTIVLLLTPVLLTVWKYYGSVSFYHQHLSSSFILFDNSALTAEWFHFFSTLILFGVVPLLIIKFLFKENFSSYGLQFGDWKLGLKLFFIAAPFLILSTYPSSKMPDFLAEYPFYKNAGISGTTFFLHSLMYAFYYIGWEIFFRGFMQFGIRSTFGDWHTVLIQTMASCLVHIGKPDGEIFSSILGGIVWGIIVFRTRSIWSVFLMHWLLGVSLDFFICFFR